MKQEPLIGVSITHARDQTRVEVTGELDGATAPILFDALTEALAERAPLMLVDFAGVGFLDSTGLRVLLRIRDQAACAGSAFQLVNVHPAPRRFLAICGLSALFLGDDA